MALLVASPRRFMPSVDEGEDEQQGPLPVP